MQSRIESIETQSVKWNVQSGTAFGPPRVILSLVSRIHELWQSVLVTSRC
jgi:hypothetical protein